MLVGAEGGGPDFEVSDAHFFWSVFVFVLTADLSFAVEADDVGIWCFGCLVRRTVNLNAQKVIVLVILVMIKCVETCLSRLEGSGLLLYRGTEPMAEIVPPGIWQSKENKSG